MIEIVDGEFTEPRLAGVYDALDPDRSDLDEYERIVIQDFGAESVLDIGCGTGVFALRMAERGLEAAGVDPAVASIDVARSKANADTVTWHIGTSEQLPQMQVDAATMTANVAQVFVTDEDFHTVLTAAFLRLRIGGVLAFEARRPEDRAWERWSREQSATTVDIPEVGLVETWAELRTMEGEVTTHAVPVVFHGDGTRYESISTLRFRTRETIERALREAGFAVRDVRDLQYAPGRGWLYIAVKP